MKNKINLDSIESKSQLNLNYLNLTNHIKIAKNAAFLAIIQNFFTKF